jgi:hypothetical protein
MTSLSPAAAEPPSQAAVGQAAATLGLVVPAEDLEAVVAYVGVLRAFAARLGDPADEPAAVFRP